MARKHYHQGQNTPGYLPESDVYAFTSRRAAVAAAIEAVRELRDDGYIVYGSNGDYIAHHSPTGSDARKYDLGIHVWVEPCTGTDCEKGRAMVATLPDGSEWITVKRHSGGHCSICGLPIHADELLWRTDYEEACNDCIESDAVFIEFHD